MKIKLFNLFLVIVLLICSATICTGCHYLNLLSNPVESIYGENPLKSNDYFLYQYKSIVGLTEKGKQLEEIVFPKEIDGMNIRYLGKIYNQGNIYTWGNNYFDDSHPQKVFIHENIKSLNGSLWGGHAKVFFISVNPPWDDSSTGDYIASEYFVPALYYEKLKLSHPYFINRCYLFPSNISYMNNYSDEVNGGYHWIDNLEIDEKIKVIPEEPIREGYKFDGWYLDAEGKILFSFEDFIKGEEELILYAKWIENKLE